MKRVLAGFVLMLLCTASVTAQKKEREVDARVVQDFLEKLIENDESNTDFTDLQDQLLFYYRNPLNLNKTTREELERLPFLTAPQISSLIQHREKYGAFLSIYELQAVDGLSIQQIQSLLLFADVDEGDNDAAMPVWQMFTKAGNELYLTTQRTLETSRGYTDTSASGQYGGSPYRYLLRYGHRYGTRLSFGITAEKDAGESFFEGANKNGFDFYSAHLFLRNTGIFKTLALGDYQAAFGQGLTFASGLAFGKSPFVLNSKRNFQTLRPYRSVNENEFLRGAAATIVIKKWELTALFSNKYVDGNLGNTDTLVTDASFTSIVSSGYHRTVSEVNDKHSTRQMIYGGHLARHIGKLDFGFTGIRTVYDRAFVKSSEPYNLYEFSGKSLLNMGVDYSFHHRNAVFYGETSMSDNKALATTNGVLAALSSQVDINILYRSFARNYHTTYSNAFGESSRNINESGLYIGLSVRPVPRWTLNMFADWYHSPWLKYLADGPSTGHDYLAELSYAPSKTVQMYWRLRQDNKQKNAYNNTSVSDYLTPHQNTHLRYHISYKVSATVSMKSRIEYSEYQTVNTKTEHGTVMLHDIIYKKLKSPVTFTGRMAWFGTDGYNSRIYTYEPDLLYQFSVPALQDKGLRTFMLIHYRVSERVQAWVKCARTIYSDKETTGSGADLINANHKTDLKLQVRISF